MFGWFKKKPKEKKVEVPDIIKEQATEAMVEAIIEEVKKDIKKEKVIQYSKPNHFPDCNCFKCERWRKQNA